MKNLLSLNNNKLLQIALILIFMSIYFLESSPVIKLNPLTMPIFWLLLAMAIWKLPCKGPAAKRKHKTLVKTWAIILGIIHVAMLVLAGLVDGFGSSPYSHTILGILSNSWIVAPPLLAREIIRGYLINNSMGKKENTQWIVLVSMGFAVATIPFARFLSLSNIEQTAQFIAQHLGPEFANSILASYLAYFGGPIASIIYLGIHHAFHWLSPILPNLRWITTAAIGILTPVFSLLAFQHLYAVETKRIKVHRDKESILGWMITSVFCITIIWFAVGVFPIYPSVVATGSMQPMIDPGDVIIIEKVTDMEGLEALKVGDVIQFKQDNILITHRIEEVNVVDGVVNFTTKGDNNSESDRQPVKPEQVRGRIVKVVPKVGWPTLLLKQQKDIPLDEVEF